MLNWLTRLFLLSAAANVAGETAPHTAEEKGWLKTFIDQLFDPAWNEEHRVTIWAVVLGVLLATGFGLPTPEDIWLMLGGFTTWLASGEQFIWYNYLFAVIACSLACVLGDLVAWGMGYKWGLGIRRFRIIKRVITDKRLARVQGWFDNYGLWAVFFGRLVAGVRFVTFVMAGTMKIKWWKFALIDFLACCCTVPLWLFLGSLIAVKGRDWAESVSRNISGGVLITLGVGVVIAIVIFKIRSARSAARDEAEGEVEADLSKPLPKVEEKPADEADFSKEAGKPTS